MDNTKNFTSPLTLRKLRQSPLVRELNKSVRVSVEQLIQPLFVVEGLLEPEPIDGLTGVYRDNLNTVLTQIDSDLKKGVNKFLLFGVPKDKGTHQFDFSFTASAIKAIKDKFKSKVFLFVDVCLCSSTEHGQCGVLSSSGDSVLNQETVDQLVKASVLYSKAGADGIAPSDMMDGRIGAIREALGEIVIMSYSAKFHSKFYGPFRAAADSAPKGNIALKDRATYQIDPATPKDALESSLRDAKEGADILMVKPGMPYLDVLKDLSSTISKPWAVYEVSGEFAAIELMAEKGLMNGPAAHVEAWIAFVRAGAQMIITYGARSAKDWLEQNK